MAQNTAWRILFFYGLLVKLRKLVKLTVKTFSVGHTFTMCDAYFGGVEHKAHKKQCEKQADWEQLMKGSKIDVTSLEQEQFKSWDWLDKIFRKPR